MIANSLWRYSDFVMISIEERRASIKLRVKLDKTFIETSQMIQTVYGH